MKTSVGVVIPSYNESENIARLVTDILRFLPESQVIVVDDSPDERTVDAARSVSSPRSA